MPWHDTAILEHSKVETFCFVLFFYPEVCERSYKQTKRATETSRTDIKDNCALSTMLCNNQVALFWIKSQILKFLTYFLFRFLCRRPRKVYCEIPLTYFGHIALMACCVEAWNIMWEILSIFNHLRSQMFKKWDISDH